MLEMATWGWEQVRAVPSCGAICLSSKTPQLFYRDFSLEIKEGYVVGVFPLSWDTLGCVCVVVPKVLVPLCSSYMAPH